jgi:sucrose-6-phosphate hydrolase SacC (GH32 family)
MAENKNFQLPAKIDFDVKEAKSFSIIFSNEHNEVLTAGYDEKEKHFYINRKQSGETDFEKTSLQNILLHVYQKQKIFILQLLQT